MTEFTTELPRDRTSIHAARRLVSAHAAGLSDAQLADACLMVSELVTNALVHGRGAIGLRIATAPDRVTIEVADDGNGDVEVAPAPGPAGRLGPARRRRARRPMGCPRGQHASVVRARCAGSARQAFVTGAAVEERRLAAAGAQLVTGALRRGRVADDHPVVAGGGLRRHLSLAHVDSHLLRVAVERVAPSAAAGRLDPDDLAGRDRLVVAQARAAPAGSDRRGRSSRGTAVPAPPPLTPQQARIERSAIDMKLASASTRMSLR